MLLFGACNSVFEDCRFFLRLNVFSVNEASAGKEINSR
jgi:hypothetical protein